MAAWLDWKVKPRNKAINEKKNCLYSPLNCFTTGALFSLSPPLCKNNNNTLILLNSEQLFAEGNDIFSSIYIVDIQWAYNEQLFCNSLNVYKTEMGKKKFIFFSKNTAYPNRLQNNPYLFKHARTVEQNAGARLKTEGETGERRTPHGRVKLARKRAWDSEGRFY